jgi:hypothetical protein
LRTCDTSSAGEGIAILKRLGTIGFFGLALIIAPALIAHAESSSEPEEQAQLKVIEVKDPDGQILSYRHLAGSTEVQMRGTRLARGAKLHLKVGSRPGFVELDINRGAITGLRPAHRLGKDYLTYVLWAVSVDGRASNLGEITFEDDQPISVNVTTPYQTFWLMVTAEPNFAVVDPSPRIVLYSVGKKSAKETSDKRALVVRSDLFYFTHYTTYDSAQGGAPESAPNQLLQARKAVELASKSGVLASDRSAGTKEEEYTREALVQAKAFLARAEAAYRKDPKGRDVVQFARTAAQSAENARSLAMGAVGGLLQRQLENNVVRLRQQLAKLRGSKNADGKGASSTLAQLASQPALWFAVAGWGVAIALLFRRRTM